jgi:hypothetical protein
MSEFDGDNGWAAVGLSSGLSTQLMRMLTSDDIVPGSAPSYEVCKTIYVYHPLGAKMAEAPIKMAQTKPRKLTVEGGPEERLVEAFEREWKALGADRYIRNTHALSRVYGIASCVAIAEGIEPNEPIPLDKLHELDLTFNVVDPLNTAGSLVLEQDPNKPGFLKPGDISIAGKPYHPSRACVMLNEQPVYIEWTNSAYGFVGRSVYQRALFPLKSFIQSMITDQAVTEKAGLLVMKLDSPGSIIDRVAQAFYALKREHLKGAKTGNVLSIGTQEDVASLNFQNLEGAASFARNNILKNIATAADMPAVLLNQETFAEGFGEGTEDAKKVAGYIDWIRAEVEPLYSFFDDFVMRRAWNPEWYKSIQSEFPEEYGSKSYDEAFYSWKNAFKASWQNLLEEPDSEKVKTDDVVTKAAVSLFEVLSPKMPQEEVARLAGWVADVFNSRETFKGTPLYLDEEAISSYEPAQMMDEPRPEVESSHL